MGALQQIAKRPRGGAAPDARRECGPVRKSLRGRWRGASLILVHVAVALHVAHWLATGTTLTPVEPSEAMQTLGAKALLNAGFVFFVLLILSTLVFGRFFCGWACHVVALQDLCTWILRKLKIQGKPFRSRLLLWVPLLAALYMFALPTVVRLASNGARDPLRPHFTTDAFWDRFPSWPIALLTFAVCGFLVVYLLGNKGFCTYGCPYGGIFGLADQLAPGKIRVTEACEGCGHCTATCTSNVRVHEEVRTFGMVVNPGCMKCLDCVNVCPKDALYFGFGAPSLAKGKPRGKPAPKVYDFSVGEEAALGAFFVASIVVLAGLYDRVPFLLALGLSAISAYVLLTAARMAYVPNLRLTRHSLRLGGKSTRAGRVFLGVAALWLLFLAQSGLTKWLTFEGTGVIGRQASTASVGGEVNPAELERGIALLERALSLSLVPMGRIEAGIAEAHAALGEKDAAEEHYRRAVAQAPRYADGRVKLARYLNARGARDEAIEQLREAVRIDPETPAAAGDLADLLLQSGRGDEAAMTLADLLARRPFDADLRLSYGVVLAHLGKTDESVAEIERVTTARPDFSDAFLKQAQILAAAGRFAEALVAVERAATIVPEYVPAHMLAAQIATHLGQEDVTLRHLDAALRSKPYDSSVAAIWARSVTRTGGIASTITALAHAAPEDLPARFRLLHLYREAGRTEPATAVARDLEARGVAVPR